jgi:uncharacterized protein (UPF0332 family)
LSQSNLKGYIARAEGALTASKILIENECHFDSINRSYYAMFYAATAVLLALGVERSSHKALIGAFGEFVVKKGFMENKFHSFFQKAFEARSDADYQPFPAEPKEQAELMHQRAVEFVAACRTFLGNRP